MGWFHVSGERVIPALIKPSEGQVGGDFTIDDPMKRMQAADNAVFYCPGDDPLTGTPADLVSVSADGAVLNGKVPAVPAGLQYYVAVVSPTGEIRFAGLGFLVSV